MTTADLPRFTGDAAPYGGGDPYADYRTADFPFTHLADLADRRLGAGVIAANDEFFAERENLLKPEPAHFDPEAFGHKGKIMDGWETRRRRGVDGTHPFPTDEDHDWALIRLGAPGVIRGIVVDTAHFRGNYPQSVSVEGTCVAGSPSPGELLADDIEWTTLVPRTAVGGHAANGFAVDIERRFTHLRAQPAPRRRRRPPAGPRRGRARPRSGWPRWAPSISPRWRTAAGSRTPRTASTPRPPTPSSRAAPARWTTAGRPGAAAVPATTGCATASPSRP